MKNYFGFNNTLDITDERSSEFEGTSLETSYTEKQRKQIPKIRNRISKDYG